MVKKRITKKNVVKRVSSSLLNQKDLHFQEVYYQRFVSELIALVVMVVICFMIFLLVANFVSADVSPFDSAWQRQSERVRPHDYCFVKINDASVITGKLENMTWDSGKTERICRPNLDRHYFKDGIVSYGFNYRLR
jgi:hypothetical protein